ncbi:MAG: SnoaL-like domain-containing protein [Gemmatimonadales bacterium]
MSTTQLDIRTLDKELNTMILSGQIMEGFEKFYAEDCIMRENSEEPRVGKDANREIEKAFVDSIEEFHGAELLASAVSGDVSFSEWAMDVTFKGAGRVQMAQAAVRRWKDGQVAEERFYYNKG